MTEELLSTDDLKEMKTLVFRIRIALCLLPGRKTVAVGATLQHFLPVN